MLSKVDLPEPLVPMMGHELAGVDGEAHPPQGGYRLVTHDKVAPYVTPRRMISFVAMLSVSFLYFFLSRRFGHEGALLLVSRELSGRQAAVALAVDGYGFAFVQPLANLYIHAVVHTHFYLPGSPGIVLLVPK